MVEKTCHIVVIGHNAYKYELTIDRISCNRLILITGKENQSGTTKIHELSKQLKEKYEKKKIEVKEVRLSYSEDIKSVAELIYLILKQRIEGFNKIFVNISGGLRYIDVWFYIACIISNTDVIHGDYVYEDAKIANIKGIINLTRLPLVGLTDKQFDLLELFFNKYDDINDFIKPDLLYDDNILLNKTIKYDSTEKIKDTYNKKKGLNLSRGDINICLHDLKNIEMLKILPNPEDKKKKTIEITYFGIANFLNYLFEKNIEYNYFCHSRSHM